MPTELELQQTLAALSAEVQALRVTCAEHVGTIDALHKQIAAHDALQRALHDAHPKSTFVRRAPVVTEAQAMYRANCEAARAQAIATGKSVVVAKP